jgi:hypothetical protein
MFFFMGTIDPAVTALLLRHEPVEQVVEKHPSHVRHKGEGAFAATTMC